MKLYDIAVVGATGLVGRKIVQVLEERKFPISELRLLASAKSVSKSLEFNGKNISVEELTAESFRGIEIAFFATGAPISKEYVPIAVKAGALVIDNSSAYRLEENVPLVVPEVNSHQVLRHKGIIANPNCSTIQMVVVLKPLHDKWKIKRIVVSTYQSVSGAGKRGIDQLETELLKVPVSDRKFPYQIAMNVIPHIDVFLDDGYSREEKKMVYETRKILEDETLKITATCVRVPVLFGHSEAINLEFENSFSLEEVRSTLENAPGVVIQDEIARDVYPMPIQVQERDEVFVGRIRRDDSVKHGLNLWVVANNLRKGAATNAVQIAEEWIKRK